MKAQQTAPEATLLLTRQEAANAMRISLRTLDQIVASNELKVVKIGRAIRVRRGTLESFIAAREGN
jgi:excisionase family DNA binding protein